MRVDFFFYRYGDHRDLHSFPTRRSADLLLYDSLIEDGILLLHDGGLLAGWKFRGPDLGSATHGEMATLSARLGAILRLGSGWMVKCDSIRSQAPGYPAKQQFPDSITRIIDY